MTRHLVSVLVVVLSSSAVPAYADSADAAQSRSFRPIWTAVGAGAGFGLGVWIGLTKFDDAINSDRKVWTTAVVSAAVGGVVGFLVDRHQGRTANPSRTSPFVPDDRAGISWRKAVYGSSGSPASLRLPSVSEVTGLTARGHLRVAPENRIAPAAPGASVHASLD